jgi:subtilisin family serine protease
VISVRTFRRTLSLALATALLAAATASARPVTSPALRAVDAGNPIPGHIPTEDLPGVGTVIDVFLEGAVGVAELEGLGVVIGSRLPNGVMTAKVPVALLDELRELPGLTRLQAAYRLNKHHNASVPNTKVTPNYWTASPPNFTGEAGEDVIVGIVDSGLDWSHPDFDNPDGTTRILEIWDQNVAGTPPPGFAYGTRWTAAQIDGGTCTHTDVDGHGTHVAGSAAGDGSHTGNGQPANVFIGMAPRADIIGVATNFNTSGVVDGVNYIFQRAAALGKPAVVNLSLGGQFGAHDGTETFDTAIDALTGPGKIVVASAGNEGNQSLHAEQLVPAGPAQTVTFSVPAYTANGGAANDYVIIDAYYQGSNNMSVTLTSPGPSPVTVGPVTLGNVGANAASLAGNIYVENGATPSPSGDNNVYIQIYDSNSARPPRQGTWTITLTPVSTTPSTEIDLWMAGFLLGNAGVVPIFTSDVDNAELIGSPGTATEVVTVGAFTTKQSWPSIDGNSYSFVGSTPPGTLAGFSSPGPRRDGVQKPDISAPGTAIVSARSTATPGIPNALIHPDGVHWTQQGTSMSAPHVTGGVALYLADDPTMTPADVKAKLYADAVTDGNTGAVPNKDWGYGKLRMLRDDMTPPTVTVTHPNGGESFDIGDNVNITWTASDNIGVTAIDIEFSDDNGAAWTTVATGEANDGTYPWVVPNTVTVLGLIRVTARDAATNSASDVSNANFSITDGTPPTVTVLAPNGGESFVEGGMTQITWNASDDIGVVGIDLEYSDNNGGSWTTIALGEANDGTFDWTIPAVTTTQALVRVTAHDQANATSDVSDAVFNITLLSGTPDAAVLLTRPVILQNRPNPFASPAGTSIGFGLPARGTVSIRIYSPAGELVRTLASGEYDAGWNEVVWDGRSDTGQSVASGLYLYRFQSGSVVTTRRMILTK